MTILTFPSTPVNGGTFDLDADYHNFSVGQLTSNKFVVLNRQNDPNYTLAQVIEVVDENTVNFNTTWILNALSETRDVGVHVVNSAKVIFYGFQETPKNLFFQLFEIDGNDDIVAGEITTFPMNVNHNPIGMQTVVENDTYLFYYNSGSIDNLTALRIFVSGNSITSVSAGPQNLFDLPSDTGAVIFKNQLSANSRFFGFRSTFETTLVSAPISRITNPAESNWGTSWEELSSSGENLVTDLGGSVNLIDGDFFAGDRIIMAVEASSLPNQVKFVEYDPGSDDFIAYQFNVSAVPGRRFVKVDDYHFATIDNNEDSNTVNSGDTLGEANISIYRSLEPGLLQSSNSPIVAETSALRPTFRYTSNSDDKMVFTRAGYAINQDLVAFFYKTDSGYKIALLYA